MLGDHCSEREQRAADAERELTKVKLLDYLDDKIGMEMDGVITGVENFGLFVKGTELPAEGLVHISWLTDDYYRYDRAGHVIGASARATPIGWATRSAWPWRRSTSTRGGSISAWSLASGRQKRVGVKGPRPASVGRQNETRKCSAEERKKRLGKQTPSLHSSLYFPRPGKTKHRRTARNAKKAWSKGTIDTTARGSVGRVDKTVELEPRMRRAARPDAVRRHMR